MRLAIAAVVLLILVGLLAAKLGSSKPADGKPVPTPTPPVNEARKTDDALAPTVTLDIDDTVSTMPDIRKRVLEDLLVKLPALIRERGFAAIKVGHFGVDGWLTGVKEVRLPARPSVPCAEAGSAGGVFKKEVERRQREAQATCEKAREDALNDYERQLSAAFVEIRELVLATPRAADGCTAFYDVLARAAMTRTPGLRIIVSDARETCAKEIYLMPEPKPGVEVWAIVLPSRYEMGEGKSAYGEFTKKEKALKEIAPWLKIEPATADSALGTSP